MRYLCLIMLVASCFNLLRAWNLPSPESAPSEPDFTATGGGSVTIGGDTFVIKVTVHLTDQGGFIKNTTKVTKNGGTEHSYDNTTVSSPVNVVTEGVQIWVGTPGNDIIYPDTSWTQGGVIVPAIMIGMAGDDIIIGTDNSNGDVLCGNAGDDTIVALGGSDQIWGGAGSDAASGCDGNDKINGGTDGDRLGFNSIRSSFDDGDGDPSLNETWTIGSGYHSVTLSDGVDFPAFEVTVSGTDANGGLWGCAGDDKVWGEGGNDYIHGDGDTDFSVSDGSNNLYGGAGGDEITGGEGVDNIWGGADGDTILGGLDWFDNRNTDGVDYLFGEDGADTISGRGGHDYINGGADNDKLYGFRSIGWGTPDGSGTDAQFIDGGSSGEDTIIGADCKDDIMGGSERDTIKGGGKNDRIDGEAGNDLIEGGEDNDCIWCGDGDDVAAGGYGNDFITGEGGSDMLYGDENDDRLVDTSGGIDDYLFGDNNSGDNGADELNAYDGNSTGLNIHDFLQGYSPSNENFWADDADEILDVPAETPTISAGPTTPADGTARPTRP
jgi:Ca2+-binding RTX toxin-like protein